MDIAYEIVGITHPPKAPSGKAKNMFMGSLAFIANARSGFLVVPDDEVADARLFLQAKNNLAPRAKGLAFRIVECKLRNGMTSTCVEWEKNYVDVSADEAVQAEPRLRRLDEAKSFLQQLLSKGPIASKKLEQRARQMGISKRTLDRAREDLGVAVKKTADGVWYCSLRGAE